MKTPDDPFESAPGNARIASGAESAGTLRAFLREHSQPPPLRNEAFFNRSILDRIAAGSPAARPVRTEAVRRERPIFARIVWVGAGLAAAVAVLAGIRLADPTIAADDARHLSRVISAEPGDGEITAVAFESKDQRIAVLWLEGLGYIPAPESQQHVN
jgi:hypothetical protein